MAAKLVFTILAAVAETYRFSRNWRGEYPAAYLPAGSNAPPRTPPVRATNPRPPSPCLQARNRRLPGARASHARRGRRNLVELVIATGADSLTTDELAGALVALAETKDAGKREAWAKR